MSSTPPVIRLLSEVNSEAWYTTRGECDPTLPYSGFNICHYTGDAPMHIAECSRNLAKWLDVSPNSIIIPRQTHSTNVLTVTALPVTSEQLENIDALVTNLPGTVIGVNTADCVPVAMIDPVSDIIGIAHAGWRGAANGVVKATVDAMLRLGASPENIKAAMGPSICSECFEVGDEVAAIFNDYCISRTPGQKPHVSLQKHIACELKNCGLKVDNIKPFGPSLCTRHNSTRFWSARSLGINSGRVFTFVKLR